MPLADSTHGYLCAKGPVACGAEELVKVLSKKNRIHMVWTPEHLRILPVYEFSSLRGIADLRAQRRFRETLWFILGWVLFWGLPAILLIFYFGWQLKDEVWNYQFYYLFSVLGLLAWGMRLYNIYYRREIYSQSLARDYRYRWWLRQQPIFWGPALMCAWVLVLAASILLNGWFWAGFGLSNETSAAGYLVAIQDLYTLPQLWKFLTAPMAHQNETHLVLNLVGFALVFRAMEGLGGKHLLPLVFLCSCVSGALTKMLLLPEVGDTGASAGIFGINMYLCILGLRNLHRLPHRFWAWWFPFLIVTMAGEGANLTKSVHPGHLGGMICGLLMGLAFARAELPNQPKPWMSGLGLLAGLGLLTGACAAVLILSAAWLTGFSYPGGTP